jgi:hypothetical protein
MLGLALMTPSGRGALKRCVRGEGSLSQQRRDPARRACPYRGENSGAGKDDRGEPDTQTGIREHYLQEAVGMSVS